MIETVKVFVFLESYL